MSTKKIGLICEVYKSTKKDQIYLYIEKGKSLDDLPSELNRVLGTPEKVMTLNLTSDKKMSRGTAAPILKSIEEQGFHLQMPIDPQLDKNPLAHINDQFLDKDM
ncbi:MAG: YcgL domain-containing protein [Woeseiaceae bacterium]